MESDSALHGTAPIVRITVVQQVKNYSNDERKNVMAETPTERRASCFFDGKEYSDGAMTCQAGKQMRCNDGVWQDTGDPCSNGLSIQKRVTEQKVVTEPESIEKISAPHLSVEIGATTITLTQTKVAEARLTCCNFFSVGSISQLGIRNSCAQCRIAVVSWAGAGIYRYRVPGYSEIIIDFASTSGSLIGEDPC